MPLLPRLRLWCLCQLFLLSSLLGCALISWQLAAQFDFGYRWLHGYYDIAGHVQRYGPKNHYKQGLEQTTPAEQQRLFAVMVESIQHQGQGLADIRYHDVQGRDLGRLLRAPEVQHLEDVAVMVDDFVRVGTIGGVLSLVLLWRLRRTVRAGQPVVWRHQVVGLALVLGAVAAAVMSLGPKKVFYWLHEWGFPADHQWFFYYEESYMSTLMKAPWLFGGIAIALILLTIAIYCAWLVVAVRQLDRS